MKLTGKNFTEYELGKDFTGEEFYDKFGKGSTFPRVIFENKVIGGCVDTIKFLKEKREL